MSWLRLPYHPDSPLPRWLFLVVLVLAVSNLARMAAVPYAEDRPVDFRSLYVGQRMLVDGANPYDDEALKSAWQETAADGGFATEIAPGLPRTPLVYPPWAVAMFTVFSPLPYQLASRLWYLLLPVMLLGMVAVLADVAPRGVRPIVFCDLLVLAFAFKATEWAYWVGQPVFLCLLLGTVSWRLADHRRPVLAGIALGLAAFKVTLVIPFVGLMFYRRRFAVLTSAAATGAVLSGLFVALSSDPWAATGALRDTVAELRRITFDPSAPGYPLSFKMVTKTELAALAGCLIPGSHRWAAAVNAIPLVGLAALWRRTLVDRTASDALVLSVLAVATLLTTHHLHYDCLVLLPVYLVARTVDTTSRAVLVACGAVFLLPINGALNLLPPIEGLQWLYFNVQLGLIGMAAALTWVRTRSQQPVPSGETAITSRTGPPGDPPGPSV